MSPQCDSCGSWVSHEFARVAGGNDGTVARCLDCYDKTGLAEGAAAGLGGDRR